MEKCFYCDKKGKNIIDDKNGMWFLCDKHYRLFLAKYGKKPKNKDEEFY